MATLILGGGSQIGLRLAELLQESGKPVIFGSRSGSRIPADTPSVKFDWEDATTFETPFAQGQKIDYVYILGPSDYDPLVKSKPFIDLAVSKGVKRFIILSASGDHTDRGPDAKEMGRVHTYVHDQGLDYVALRPTWFTGMYHSWNHEIEYSLMRLSSENLSRFYAHSIKEKNLIENVVEKGPVAFVAVEDIAQAAFRGITDVESLHTREPLLVGPDLVSYQDVRKSEMCSPHKSLTLRLTPL